MDPFKKLIEECGLYPMETLMNMVANSPHWQKEDSRKNELYLRHLVVCILLCNREPSSMEDVIETMLTGLGKRKIEASLEDEPASKKLRSEEGESVIAGSSTTQGSSGSSGKIETGWEQDELKFRYILLEGTPALQLKQAYFARRFNCLNPTNQWDIVDTKEQKFIEVKVSQSPLAIEKYRQNSVSVPNNSGLIMVNPTNGEIQLFDKLDVPNGHLKVRDFLLKRSQTMLELGISDNDLLEEPNIEEKVFQSDYINGLTNQWVNDWWVERENIESVEEVHKLIKECAETPKAIYPIMLKEKLDNLKGPERVETVKWKGKLTPEGWTLNHKTEFEGDANLVSEFVNNNLLEYEGKFKGITKALMVDDMNIFDVKVPHEDQKHLGVGQKQRTFFPGNLDTKQEEYAELPKLKYDTYYDEIFRRLSHKHELMGNPLINLLENSIKSKHPAAQLSTDAVIKLTSLISKTKAAVYSNKLTNVYSRLGGSFLFDHKIGNLHSRVVVFPIYSTHYNHHLEVCARYVSGIVIRGPQHARSPTDRIPILVIETIPRGADIDYYLSKNPPQDIFLKEDRNITFRINSIMREDCSYVTFVHNSLFIPANLLGVLSFENPQVPVKTDMAKIIDELLSVHGLWFVQRFVEGVVFAACANPRDEGYFSMLRKLYMILLSFRRDSYAACWNLSGFCDKVNECLVDNPISMHFHNTLLFIINDYCSSNN
uniref:Putative polymerase PA n=1 Tax=Soybean thrips quaranja-like virus 4 TaxID=2796553 RepID=A0A7T3R0Q5_9ORTO|nr:putative polymerase PA [Soybean thrips quaranja-like virus 4]